MTKEKSRETRIRHALARQGYTLSKSRRRDPRALDFGRYTITDGTGAFVYEAPVLDGIEKWLNDENSHTPNAPTGWEKAGRVGIDTGTVLLADPCFEGLSQEALGATELTDGVARCTNSYGVPIAMLVGTGVGDGWFPVSVRRDQDGQVTAVRIDFTYDEEIQP
ncbi:MAG TPA: hypothetical protein VHZ03_27945 [Trebonia sp.]|jgi:hypothetical protein|nr:hypothetical protein [Trebonia sp.]